MYYDQILYPETDDYYFDKNGNIVYSREYLIKRGYCCGNHCNNCPYTPKYKKGNRNLKN